MRETEFQYILILLIISIGVIHARLVRGDRVGVSISISPPSRFLIAGESVTIRVEASIDVEGNVTGIGGRLYIYKDGSVWASKPFSGRGSHALSKRFTMKYGKDPWWEREVEFYGKVVVSYRIGNDTYTVSKKTRVIRFWSYHLARPDLGRFSAGYLKEYLAVLPYDYGVRGLEIPMSYEGGAVLTYYRVEPEGFGSPLKCGVSPDLEEREWSGSSARDIAFFIFCNRTWEGDYRIIYKYSAEGHTVTCEFTLTRFFKKKYGSANAGFVCSSISVPDDLSFAYPNPIVRPPPEGGQVELGNLSYVQPPPISIPINYKLFDGSARVSASIRVDRSDLSIHTYVYEEEKGDFVLKTSPATVEITPATREISGSGFVVLDCPVEFKTQNTHVNGFFSGRGRITIRAYLDAIAPSVKGVYREYESGFSFSYYCKALKAPKIEIVMREDSYTVTVLEDGWKIVGVFQQRRGDNTTDIGVGIGEHNATLPFSSTVALIKSVPYTGGTGIAFTIIPSVTKPSLAVEGYATPFTILSEKPEVHVRILVASQYPIIKGSYRLVDGEGRTVICWESGEGVVTGEARVIVKEDSPFYEEYEVILKDYAFNSTSVEGHLLIKFPFTLSPTKVSVFGRASVRKTLPYTEWVRKIFPYVLALSIAELSLLVTYYFARYYGSTGLEGVLGLCIEDAVSLGGTIALLLLAMQSTSLGVLLGYGGTAPLERGVASLYSRVYGKDFSSVAEVWGYVFEVQMDVVNLTILGYRALYYILTALFFSTAIALPVLYYFLGPVARALDEAIGRTLMPRFNLWLRSTARLLGAGLDLYYKVALPTLAFYTLSQVMAVVSTLLVLPKRTRKAGASLLASSLLFYYLYPLLAGVFVDNLLLEKTRGYLDAVERAIIYSNEAHRRLAQLDILGYVSYLTKELGAIASGSWNLYAVFGTLANIFTIYILAHTVFSIGLTLLLFGGIYLTLTRIIPRLKRE